MKMSIMAQTLFKELDALGSNGPLLVRMRIKAPMGVQPTAFDLEQGDQIYFFRKTQVNIQESVKMSVFAKWICLDTRMGRKI